MCESLRKLYEFAIDREVNLSRADLVHRVCGHCQRIDVCPGVGMSEYQQLEQRGLYQLRSGA